MEDPEQRVGALERLGKLKAEGVLTDEEFEWQKQSILGNSLSERLEPSGRHTHVRQTALIISAITFSVFAGAAGWYLLRPANAELKCVGSNCSNMNSGIQTPALPGMTMPEPPPVAEAGPEFTQLDIEAIEQEFRKKAAGQGARVLSFAMIIESPRRAVGHAEIVRITSYETREWGTAGAYPRERFRTDRVVLRCSATMADRPTAELLRPFTWECLP